MGWINNERYATVVERIRLFKGRFVCAWLPCYGLVKIDDKIIKLPGYEGSLYHYPEELETIVIEYIKEKYYIDGFRGEKMSEDAIYNTLVKRI